MTLAQMLRNLGWTRSEVCLDVMLMAAEICMKVLIGIRLSDRMILWRALLAHRMRTLCRGMEIVHDWSITSPERRMSMNNGAATSAA